MRLRLRLRLPKKKHPSPTIYKRTQHPRYLLYYRLIVPTQRYRPIPHPTSIPRPVQSSPGPPVTHQKTHKRLPPPRDVIPKLKRGAAHP